MDTQLVSLSFPFKDGEDSDACSLLFRNRIKYFHPQLSNVNMFHLDKVNYITITGLPMSLLNARTDLLRLQPIEVVLLVDTLYPGLAYRNKSRIELHEELKRIAINNDINISFHPVDNSIKLIGSISNVELARIDILLYFDRLLGFVQNNLTMPLYLINIIGNKKHSDIIAIMEETGTNIYLPSVWMKIAQPSKNNINSITFESTVHITGKTNEDVQRAMASLKKLMSQKVRSMCNSQSILSPKKRDWLLMHKRDELAKIMRDNGSYISFSNFGSDSLNQIEVYAENNVKVERTLRSLNYLASKIFEASIVVNSTESVDLVSQLSQKSGAAVLYEANINKFEIIGSEEQIEKFVQIAKGLSISQEYHELTTFSIELAEDQKEFISGKKNGKINKIMKSCDALIQYQAYNGFNFVITIESNDFFKAKDGLESLQGELPAELSFFVPEVCHRRIIGVGGKNIQRVMKEYGVYVKFSGNSELQTFGGYFENEHNVIARTPKKNIQNLQNLKSAVMEFITFQKDRDYTTCNEYVPYYMQRVLLHHHGSFLLDKGRLYNAKIFWPERNGSNYIQVTGPHSHIEEMRLRIQSLMPEPLEIKVPYSVVLEKHLKSSIFNQLQQEIYSKTQIFFVLPNYINSNENIIDELDEKLSYGFNDAYQIDDPFFKIVGQATDKSTSSINGSTVCFELVYDMNTKAQLQTARQLFNDFMEARCIPLEIKIKQSAINSTTSTDHIHNISKTPLFPTEYSAPYQNESSEKFTKQRILDPSKLSTPERLSKNQLFVSPSQSLDLYDKSHPSMNFNSFQPKVTQKEDYNVWGAHSLTPSTSISRGTSSSNSSIRLQQSSSKGTNMPKSSSSYFSQPPVKTDFSTNWSPFDSTYDDNLNTNKNSLYYHSDTKNTSAYHPFNPVDSDHSYQRPNQKHTNNFSPQANNSMYAQPSYAKQKTLSPIITDSNIERSNQTLYFQNNTNSNHHQQFREAHKNVPISPFGHYSYTQTPNLGIGSTPYSNYMNNPRLHPFDRKNPSNSLSTPILTSMNNRNDANTPTSMYHNPIRYNMN